MLGRLPGAGIRPKRIEESLGIQPADQRGRQAHPPGRIPTRQCTRRYGTPPPRPAKPPALGYTVLPATPAEELITLEDWFAGLFWFVGAGNKGSRKHVATWRHNGATWTFRHSKLPEEGGVNLARFGGRLPDGQRVHPWASFEAVEALIAETPELRESERRPCVSFAGDDDTHHPMPIGCVDADFKPDKDTDGIGAAFTAHVRQGLIDAGCPVYSSTSWAGFHAIWRLEPWQDGKLRAPVNGGRRFRAWPSDANQLFHGARVEVFAPGDKQLVALWRYRPIANCEPGHVIPVLTYRKLEAILQAAREAARGEVTEPPVVEEAPVPEPPVVEEAPVPEPPVTEEAPASVSHGMAICEKSDCGRQFRIGPISLARREAGQPLVCRSCDAVAHMPQDGPIEAAAAEPVPEPEPGSPPEYAPQTDGKTTWCRQHSLVSIGPECVYCLKGKPPLETSRGGI